MEKIYMEENNSQQSQRQSRRSFDASVVLSFVVAIFAVFSLATFGIVTNQGTDVVSYAAPLGTTTDSFTFNDATSSSGGVIQVVSTGTNGNFTIPVYRANNNASTPIFCVEHASDVEDGSTYTKDATIEDYGLLYLLNQSYANGVSVTACSTADKNYVETWVTQSAIWMYLYETAGSNTRNAMSAADVAAIKGATSLTIYYDRGAGTTSTYSESGTNLYTKYVEPLVTQAKAASSKKVLSVTKADGEVSKTTDGKYYQSTLISVVGNPSGDLKNYDVTLSGIDGAVAVDEDGKELTLNGIAAGKAFYVRIPVEKITESTQTLTINVVGHFDTLTGNYYTAKESDGSAKVCTNVSADDCNYPGQALQKVVSVTGTTKDVQDGVQIEFIGAPDTGMNTAQTIYFIGLIVLLCGVGIVYANAKPVESKQQ